MNDVIRPSKENALVEGEKFTTAWLNIDKFPGGMMMSSHGGRFGPVPAMTGCLITTSATTVEEWRLKGMSVIEVQLRNAPETRAQLPAQLVDRLMQAIESLLTEEYSKVIDESWVTAPVRRTRKALNELQAIRAKRNTSIDKEWERAKDAMTGDAPKAEGGGT